MKFVISRIDDNRKASEIIQEVHVLKAISWIKAAWEEVSDQTVTNCFRKCGFCNKDQNGVVQKIDQDEDEEFANMVKQLAGDIDPHDYVDFDKDIASSMPAVYVGSISWCLKRPADKVMDLSSHKDVDEEIEDLETVKSASDAL